MNTRVTSSSNKAVAALRKAAVFIERHAEEIVGTPYDAYISEDGVKLEVDLSEAYEGIVFVKYARNIMVIER